MSIYLGTNLISGAQDISGKANTDFDNITSTAKNIGNWSSNVTNCITYIPQDIKLELSSGTLTLKAGSKVYVPNGFETDGVTPKFDVKTVPNNLAWILNQATVMCFVTQDDTLNPIMRDYCFSGSTAPTSFQGGQYAIWYDTTNNFVKFTNNAGSTWSTGTSFPFDVVGSDDTYTIFNGFGYIGSTVFALPGVKGLIPDGRNEDGTLKNIDFEVNNLMLFTDSYQVDGSLCCALHKNNIISNYFRSGLKYNEQENMFYYNGNIVSNNIVVFANYEAQNYGKIVSFYPKTVFHALDWNDKGTIAGWGMPSSKYIDLTLLASGNSYTAPANGYFAFYSSNVANSTFYSSNGYFRSTVIGASGYPNGNIFPVKKGDIVNLSYSISSGSAIRFYYAEGEI